MIKTALNGIENMEDALTTLRVPGPLRVSGTGMAYKGTGDHWMMMDMLLVKHWPANVFVQTYAELASRLVTKYSFNPDEVEESIIVRPLPSATGTVRQGLSR